MHHQSRSSLDVECLFGSEEEENDPDLRPPETVNDPYSFHKQPPDNNAEENTEENREENTQENTEENREENTQEQ
jgi:hypothetical protein